VPLIDPNEVIASVAVARGKNQIASVGGVTVGASGASAPGSESYTPKIKESTLCRKKV
jgi:hypothetical protein